MRLFFSISLFVTLVGIGLVSSHFALADVWIPSNEFGGYYDLNGTYTVIGAVKNTEDKPIIPTVTINLKDNDKQISHSYIFSIVDSGKDIPFKFKIPEIEDKNAILEKPQVSFVVSNHNAPDIFVIYDKTLKKHPDGHTSGFILNNDTVPSYGVKVYAVIYGKDGKVLDVGKSVEVIDKLNPGEKIEFSMYPDPQHASKINYYSCFAVGDDPSLTVSVLRGGKPYNFTYLTSGSMTDAKFDDSQKSILVTARYPFPDKGFANFMFPQESNDQKFSVTANGKPIEFIQSKDPDGLWHVAFDLPPQSTTHIAISGFDQPSFLSSNNFKNYLLIIIPVVAASISIIIWKKRKD
jgi:hypothetical protein